MLRRSKTITLPDDDDLPTSTVAEDAPILPQQPSISEPLFLERRSGADRRSQEEVRTEFQRTLAFAQEHGTLPSPANAGNFGMKLRIALVAVALIAGGAAAWLATRSPAPAPEVVVAAPAAVAAPVIPMAKVLVATKAIGLGQRLTSGDVAWQDWPEATLQQAYITDTTAPDALTNISSNVARSEFVAGEPILDSKLVKTNEGFLSAVLAPGMRGVSVSVTADAASGGFIVPNDHVDVVMSRITDTVQQSQTILTDVRVLAINSRLGQTGTTGTPDPTTDAKTEIFSNTAIATLELNPTQSEIIVNATQAGKLSLVLRSLADSKGATNAAEVAANQAIRMTSPFWTK